jgi:hypothetical protein
MAQPIKLHMARGRHGGVLCGASVSADRRTTEWRQVTCQVCANTLEKLAEIHIRKKREELMQQGAQQ